MVGFREINLTQGQVAIVDEELYLKFNCVKWLAVKYPGGYYAARAIPNINGKRKQRIIYMHRIIIGAEKGELVDHINGNGLDNRINNLRLATYSQNAMNRNSEKGSSTEYKGVRFKSGKYEANIGFNSKVIYIGRFDTAEEAAIAYNKQALTYHKEYAKLNRVGDNND